MQVFRYTHRLEPFHTPLTDRYLGSLRLGVFDIETTGLSANSTHVILVGLADAETQIQYFAEQKTDERALLSALPDAFAPYDVMVSFNGQKFDWPFLQRRAALLGLPPFSQHFYHLDLYQVLNAHSQLRPLLGDLRQKTVETYMGLAAERQDTIDGGESVRLYESFLRAHTPAKKARLREKILLHNHDDILQLYRLLPILRQTDVDRAMSYLGFPVPATDGWPQLNVARLRLDHAGLTIFGTYGGAPIAYLAYDTGNSPYSCRFEPDGSFQFLLPVRRHGQGMFVRLRDVLPPSAEAAFQRYPGYVNGFLILRDEKGTRFPEQNALARALLTTFMQTVPRPAPSSDPS